MKLRNNLLLLLSFIGFASCKTLHPDLTFEEVMKTRSAQAKALERNSIETNCELNSKKVYDSLELNNNLWGQPRLKGQAASLCTFYSNQGIGWKWELPNNARGVIGYPNIKIGPGPWRNATEKLHGFPIRLDSIQSLEVVYDTEMYVKHKKYNLAFDLWLSSKFQATKETTTTEIMIWEDYFDFKSYGKKVDEVETDFGVYEVMSGYLYNEEYGQDWQYFAFIRKEKRSKGSVDIQFLLNYLIKNQKVNPQDFITSVEFGNEIGNSSGFTLIKDFQLKLQ